MKLLVKRWGNLVESVGEAASEVDGSSVGEPVGGVVGKLRAKLWTNFVPEVAGETVDECMGEEAPPPPPPPPSPSSLPVLVVGRE